MKLVEALELCMRPLPDIAPKLRMKGSYMCETENRLLRCFASVFPWLRPEEIRNIDAESAESWDSLSSVTLSAVVQEEFGLNIDPETLPNLRSFEAYRTYLRQLNPNGGE